MVIFMGIFDGMVGFIPCKENPLIMLYRNGSRSILIPNLLLVAFYIRHVSCATNKSEMASIKTCNANNISFRST